MDATARTAISRRGPSAVLRHLLREGLVRGRVLDHGCGRGADLAHLTRLGFDASGWDPHHRPERPSGSFDTVLSTYVVNVLGEAEAEAAVLDARGFLAPGGVLYVAARDDDPRGWASVQRDVREVPRGEPLRGVRGSFRLWAVAMQ